MKETRLGELNPPSLPLVSVPRKEEMVEADLDDSRVAPMGEAAIGDIGCRHMVDTSSRQFHTPMYWCRILHCYLLPPD